MKKDKNASAEAAKLRRRAEEKLRANKTEGPLAPTEAETQRLLHELQVHQIELEMQNEELQQARAELEAGLERYSELYDFAPVGYVTLDRNGAIRQVNLTGAHLLGMERARLTGMRFGLFVGEADRPVFDAFLKKIFATPTNERCEVAVLRKGDSAIFARIEGVASADGQECRSVIADMTERKRVEEALIVEKNISDSTIEGMPGIFCLFEETGKFLRWNGNFERVSGYSTEEISRMYPLDFFAGEDRRLLREKIQEIFISGQATAEAELVTKDNRKASFFFSGLRVIIDNKRCVVGTGIDITERKRAEEALRASEEKYRLLFENMLDGYAHCRMIFEYGQPQDFIYLDVNSAFEKLTGLKNVVGRKVTEVIPGIREAYPELFEIYGRVALTGKPERFEIYLEPLGMWLSIAVYSTKKEFFVAVFDNITARKKMEEEVLKARKLESIGILAGGIAHDFNNLLQAIMGNISLAKMLTNPKEKTFPLLEEAEKASEQAKELSYRLLTFSKGGDPVRLIASVENLLKESSSLCLSGSNVACELSLPEDLDLIEVDKGQMNQVFNNLLINAKEAMPDGGTVEINAANVRITGSDNLPLKEGRYVKISVADHGTGIPEKHLSRIFDPYFSTKDRGSDKGMGLGLAICHSIITKHEGHIAVESREGGGMAFHIYLPASERKHEEQAGNRGHYAAGKGRVLFMDDDERVRKITGAMLQQLGFEVVFARNGEEAVEAYRRAKEAGQTFDAAILDLTVQGGMGGEKAVVKLQEIDPEVKAVVSSGYADDPVMKDFGKYGFVSAIAKPYNAKALKSLLIKLQPRQ